MRLLAIALACLARVGHGSQMLASGMPLQGIASAESHTTTSWVSGSHISAEVDSNVLRTFMILLLASNAHVGMNPFDSQVHPAAAAFMPSTLQAHFSRGLLSSSSGISSLDGLDRPGRTAIPLMATEKERQERLRQLFGEAAGQKIAKRTRKKRVDDASVEIQMLREGMQRLAWGGIRLVDVAMAVGPLEASFEPLLPRSELLCVRLDMPLGMVVEEAEDGIAKGNPFVADIADGSSADNGGVEVGDIVRATTSVIMGMEYPPWQLMLGGVGRPKLQKVLIPTQGEPFDKVSAAIVSNSRDAKGNGQVIFVLERGDIAVDESAQ